MVIIILSITTPTISIVYYYNTALVTVLEEAITAHRHGDCMPHWEIHDRVKTMYTWHNVARRTELVYTHYFINTLHHNYIILISGI